MADWETSQAFLTDTRRKVLRGEYDGADSTERMHHTRIRRIARGAIEELIEVAASEPISNEDVFDPEQIYSLLLTLLDGPTSWSFEEQSHPLPDPDYRNHLYVAIERAQLDMETQADAGELYSTYGLRAANLRDQGTTPDSRPIHDITATERCNACGQEPAPAIQTGEGWECYNCGSDPDTDE